VLGTCGGLDREALTSRPLPTEGSLLSREGTGARCPCLAQGEFSSGGETPEQCRPPPAWRRPTLVYSLLQAYTRTAANPQPVLLRWNSWSREAQGLKGGWFCPGASACQHRFVVAGDSTSLARSGAIPVLPCCKPHNGSECVDEKLTHHMLRWKATSSGQVLPVQHILTDGTLGL
jgi:hypothetical protein